MLCNTSLNNLQETLRENALASFSHFANTVIASQLSEELCKEIEDVLEDREDYFVHTKRPRSVAIAILCWMQAHDVPVLSSVQIPSHEILRWLELDRQGAVQSETALSVEIAQDGVRLQWL